MRNLTAYQTEYETLPFEDVQARFRKRKILESLARSGARSVLEVGCGFDPMFNYYAVFERFTIVEPAERFADSAVRQASGRPGIRVVRSALEVSMPDLEPGAYDFIILSSLLHEVAEPGRLLDAARSLCGSATTVHVNVPNALSFHRLLAVEMGLIANPYVKSDTQVRMQQSHTFDLRRLETLVTSRGFRVIDKGSFFVKPFTHSQMAFLQEAGILTDAMLDGLYALSSRFPDNGSEIWMDLAPSPSS